MPEKKECQKKKEWHNASTTKTRQQTHHRRAQNHEQRRTQQQRVLHLGGVGVQLILVVAVQGLGLDVNAEAFLDARDWFGVAELLDGDRDVHERLPHILKSQSPSPCAVQSDTREDF